jgi:hypothetical protein
MQFIKSKSLKIFGLVLISIMLMGAEQPRGLNGDAYNELSASGADKYLGSFTPVFSTDVGDGWTKHTFDPDGGAGPMCIAGTPFSVFTREGNPSRLLVFEQGGGACWQDFYNCNVLAEAQEPPAPREGIWDFDSHDNPFADYSIVYMPYCDGSTFNGDNDVFDLNWQAYIELELGLLPGTGPVIRFHRGMRNQSAGMDLARATFPNASRITVAGSSAGGVGAASNTPFLARFLYGNQVHLTVFNDAGPVTVNPAARGGADIVARVNDWQFEQFFPASCVDCDNPADSTAIIRWRLDNDSTIREAFYETDADLTNRFFMDMVLDPVGFRDLVVTTHGAINAAHPDRYKRFIVTGDTSHTALQSPLFYSQDANGVLLNEWARDFLVPTPFWIDIVEDAIP